MSNTFIRPSLKNPFDAGEKVEFNIPGEISRATGGYEEAMQAGHDLIQRPIKSVSIDQIEKQHFKKRMTAGSSRCSSRWRGRRGSRSSA